MLTTLNETLDLYLEELCQDLLETCGVLLGTSTIWRTLIKSGYTMKKVCPCMRLLHFALKFSQAAIE
jgi:hypothetical protein